MKGRSRFHANPRGKDIHPSRRDVAIFRLLNRYKYLPSDYIHAFVGGHLGWLKNRLTDLRHEGYLDCNLSQFKTANARYRPLVYELGSKGRSVLTEHGIPLRTFDFLTGPFAHDLMSCQAVSSLELGCDPSLRFITPDEILTKAPGKALAHPFKYRVEVSWKGERHEIHNFSPDWEAFGFAKTLRDGTKRYNFVAGYETDAHTETLRPSELYHSSILKKILAYKKLAAEERFNEQLGVLNNLILILTVNETHKRNIMELVKEVCGDTPIFLFKTIPNFSSFEKSPPPTPALLTEPWQRVGYPDFKLDMSDEVA
jgi:hypothetical protein